MGLDWFKYLNPPLDPIITKPGLIDKLFLLLQEKEQKEYEDPS